MRGHGSGIWIYVRIIRDYSITYTLSGFVLTGVHCSMKEQAGRKESLSDNSEGAAKIQKSPLPCPCIGFPKILTWKPIKRFLKFKRKSNQEKFRNFLRWVYPTVCWNHFGHKLNHVTTRLMQKLSTRPASLFHTSEPWLNKWHGLIPNFVNSRHDSKERWWCDWRKVFCPRKLSGRAN
jgi:hypothetical protein